MIILGIDPGTATTGFAIMEVKNAALKPVDFGTIKTSADKNLDERLVKIYAEVKNLINVYQPDHLAIEELFFNTNAKTALSVGQARGVIILAARHAGVSCFEYTPLQVKQAATGYGRAEKRQVQEMVKAILRLDKIPKPDDAADALALAICHAHSLKLKEKIRVS